MPSLPWVSPPCLTFPCPFSCRWSLWKGVEISRFPARAVSGAAQPRSAMEPRWGCLQCPQSVPRAWHSWTKPCGLWVTWAGDSASPGDGAGAPAVPAVPTVGEVSLLPPESMQAGVSLWGTLTRHCHHEVSQSMQKFPNSLGSCTAKPAPGARAASASAKAPAEGPVPLLHGWSSVPVLSPCPALCQAVWGGLGAGQIQHGAHCQPGCPSVRAQILPPLHK